MKNKAYFLVLCLIFFWHGLGYAACNSHDCVAVNYTFEADFPSLKGYRHDFHDGLVLSQEKKWIATFSSSPVNEGLTANEIISGNGSAQSKEAHTIWYRSQAISPNAYRTRFAIGEAKDIYPDFIKSPKKSQTVSTTLCETNIQIEVLWWLAQPAQITQFIPASNRLGSLCEAPILARNWNDASFSQKLNNPYQTVRDANIHFTFVNSGGFHAQSDMSFSYQLGLENGHTEKIKRYEFPVFDTAGINKGLCSLLIKETKTDIAVYSLFSNYKKAEGGYCMVIDKNQSKEDKTNIINASVDGVGYVASGKVLSFQDKNNTPRDITDIVIALSPPSVIPSVPLQPANYVKSDAIEDKIYHVTCLNNPGKEILFWEEYDVPGQYTNGANHIRYNGQGALTLEQARKDIGQTFCKLPLFNPIESSGVRENSYYDVRCLGGIGGVTFWRDGFQGGFTNGSEYYRVGSGYVLPSLDEFNKIVGVPYCLSKVNNPYYSKFPVTYIKSDSITDKNYRVTCFNDVSAGDTIFWEVNDSPSTYTNGLNRFAYQGKTWNIEQARKDIGQPFCKSPPSSYIKSSQKRDYFYYDVVCVNDLKSTFSTRGFDYTNGQETFTMPSRIRTTFGMTVEEVDRWVGQPFCKLKVNKENN